MIERIEARAKGWSPLARSGYVLAKWTLVAIGAMACFGLAIEELSEKRAGLGSGVMLAVIVAGVDAFMRFRSRTTK